jgi:hypothetical protein
MSTSTDIKAIVHFCGIDCHVDCSQFYAQNRSQRVIRLLSAETDANVRKNVVGGMPVATATVCIPGYPFEPGTTAIKDYSENEGILAALVSAGVVRDEGNSCMSGLTPIPVVRLTESGS